MKPRIHEARDEQLVSLHREHGWTYGQLAAVYGLSRSAVAGAIWRYERIEA